MLAYLVALWLALVALLLGGSVSWMHWILLLVSTLVLLVLLLLLLLLLSLSLLVLLMPTLPSLLCCLLLQQLAESKLGPCSPVWRPT